MYDLFCSNRIHFILFVQNSLIITLYFLIKLKKLLGQPNAYKYLFTATV